VRWLVTTEYSITTKPRSCKTSSRKRFNIDLQVADWPPSPAPPNRSCGTRSARVRLPARATVAAHVLCDWPAGFPIRQGSAPADMGRVDLKKRVASGKRSRPSSTRRRRASGSRLLPSTPAQGRPGYEPGPYMHFWNVGWSEVVIESCRTPRRPVRCRALPRELYLKDVATARAADRLADVPVPSRSTLKISIMMAALAPCTGQFSLASIRSDDRGAFPEQRGPARFSTHAGSGSVPRRAVMISSSATTRAPGTWWTSRAWQPPEAVEARHDGDDPSLRLPPKLPADHTQQ